MPNIDITDDITDVIPDGGTADVTDDSTPDQPIDSDVDDDADREPDDYDQTDAEDMGTGGDPIPPDSTPPAEELPEPVPAARTILQAEFISDYSAANLAQYEQSGAVPYAVYDDGTERQVAWADVSDPTPAPVVVVSEAAEVAAATNQHFWQNSTDSATYGGAGVHVTDDEKDAWVQAVAAGFPDIATKPWHNILINSLGILLRTGLRNLVSITKSAIAFFDGNGNSQNNVVASFGANGAQIGKLTGRNLKLTETDGFEVWYGTGTRLAKFSDTIEFGGRDSRGRGASLTVTKNGIESYDYLRSQILKIVDLRDNANGGVPFSETFDGDGSNTTFNFSYLAKKIASVKIDGTIISPSAGASGYYSTTAVVDQKLVTRIWFGANVSAPAVGSTVEVEYYIEDISAYSATIGDRVGSELDEGWNSFAVGVGTYASGEGASAIGYMTQAASNDQIALGRCNVRDEDGTYVLILGNGTDGENRSNALAVTWDGSTIAQAWAGVIQMFAGSTPPSGWLICDGSAVSRTTYAALFAAIGTTWGAGNGSTTFNIPDLRGRAPIGAGEGSGLTARTLGAHNIGEETHKLTIDEMPKHGHRSHYYSASGGSGDGVQFGSTYKTSGDTESGSMIVRAGGDGAHNNMQPSAVVNFIIHTGKF